MIFRSAAIELPAVAFHPLTSIPAQSFIRRRHHLNDYINSEHLPATRHYRCALYIIILYSRRSRVRCRLVVYRILPGTAPSFSTVSGDTSNSNKTGKTVSRHVLLYSFRKRNTHSPWRPRTNRLVSLYAAGDFVDIFLSDFFYFLAACLQRENV